MASIQRKAEASFTSLAQPQTRESNVHPSPLFHRRILAHPCLSLSTSQSQVPLASHHQSSLHLHPIAIRLKTTGHIEAEAVKRTAYETCANVSVTGPLSSPSTTNQHTTSHQYTGQQHNNNNTLHLNPCCELSHAHHICVRVSHKRFPE